MELLEQVTTEREQKYLSDLADRVSAVASEPPTTSLHSGLVVDALGEHASRMQADLVVMTTHGRGPFSRFWLGSVVDKLIRRLPVPVLLIRPADHAVDITRDPVFRQILIPLDGSELGEQILETAIELGSLTRSEYTLLRVVMPLPASAQMTHSSVAAELNLGPSFFDRMGAIPENERRDAQEYLGRIAERLRQRGHTVEVEVASHWNPATEILERSEHGVDLVALATHGHGGLTRLILGSVADKVIRGATTPVLVQTVGIPPSHGRAGASAAN